MVVPQAFISLDWMPQRQLVTNVTNAFNAVVTTDVPNLFADGIYVLLNVPAPNPMVIINQRAKITVIDATSFSTDFDTTQLAAFSAPTAPEQFTPAQVSPIAGQLFFNSTPGSPTGNPTG